MKQLVLVENLGESVTTTLVVEESMEPGKLVYVDLNGGDDPEEGEHVHLDGAQVRELHAWLGKLLESHG